MIARLRRGHVCRWILALCIAWGLGSGASLEGSVVVPLSLSQLVAAAAVVVDGEVVAVHVTADSGRVERIVSVRVRESWKGDAADVVHVRLPGGVLGRTRVIVPGVPEVREGARLVWFLAPGPRGAYVVVGLHQGAMSVQTSPTTGAAQVSSVPAGPAGAVRRGDGTRRPRALAALEADVRTLAAETAP